MLKVNLMFSNGVKILNSINCNLCGALSAAPSLPTAIFSDDGGTPKWVAGGLRKIFQIFFDSFSVFVCLITLKIYLNKLNFTTLTVESVNNP